MTNTSNFSQQSCKVLHGKGKREKQQQIKSSTDEEQQTEETKSLFKEFMNAFL